MGISLIGTTLLVLVAGCASSSGLDKSAEMPLESGNYYQAGDVSPFYLIY